MKMHWDVSIIMFSTISLDTTAILDLFPYMCVYKFTNLACQWKLSFPNIEHICAQLFVSIRALFSLSHAH